jgi:phage shock protein PspC (stress-responsive transcriptional regulator)
MNKKLTKSTNKMISGVCAGIAEYFNLDPTIVRILWVVFVIAGGSGILAYIICAILIPEPSSGGDFNDSDNFNNSN